jgi:hypothetical protein
LSFYYIALYKIRQSTKKQRNEQSSASVGTPEEYRLIKRERERERELFVTAMYARNYAVSTLTACTFITQFCSY